MVTFRTVQCHPGLACIFFWHLGTLALKAEHQNTRMSEIKNVGWMVMCNQLTFVPSKGLSDV